MKQDIATIRDEIIEAALPHVPFDGWTQRAIQHGAADAGIDRDTAIRAFPYGAADMIYQSSDLADRRMVAELQHRRIDQMRVRDRVTTGVRVRLEQSLPHREAVRRALGALALPQNAPTGARCLYRTVDAIWLAAGDVATDWNYYSKRGLLAGVYSTTTLFWLDDSSAEQQDSWDFLDRRIAEVMRVPQVTTRLRTYCGRLPNPFRAVRAVRTSSL